MTQAVGGICSQPVKASAKVTTIIQKITIKSKINKPMQTKEL